MNFAAAYGLLAHAMIFGALLALPAFGIYRGRVALAATALSLMVGIAPILLAVFGPPSTTLLCLALLHLAGRWPATSTRLGAYGIAAAAAVLYLSATRWFPGDLYALGYQPWPLLIATAAAGLLLWWKNQPLWLLILAVDLAAYAGGLFDNLWNALLDPLLAALALVWILREPLGRLIASRRR